MEGNSPSVSEDSKPLEVNEQKNRVENEESLDTKKNENEQRLSNLLEQPQESKEKQGEQDNTKVNWVIRRTGSSDQRSPSPTSSSTANAAASLQSLQQQQPENSSVHQWKFPSMPPQHAYMPVPTPFPPGHTPMPNYMRTPPSSSPINTLSLPSSPYLSYPPPTSPLSMGLYAAPNGHLGTPYFLSSPPPPPLSASQIPTNSSMLPAGSPLHALLSAVVDRSDVEHLRRMPAGGMESNYMFASPTPMYVPSGHPLYPSPYGYPSSFSAPQRVESPVNPPKIPSPMQYESVTRKDKTRHNKPSSRDAYKEGGEEFLYPEEARGKTSNLSKGTRFRLLEEPDEMQRKSYKKENRCLHPNPLVICKKDAKGDTQKLVDGFVTVKLVDENGMDLPVNKSACLESIDGGLTHPLDEDSSTVFSLKILQTSQGQLFRLLFTVSYRSKGQANVEEKIYSEPFGVYSNKYDRDSRRKRLKTFVYYRAGMPAPGQSSPTHV